MHWKGKRNAMGNIQFECLAKLAKKRPGHFQPLELRLERVAKQMIQGVHPWIQTRLHPNGDGTTLYAISSDGRGKVLIEAKHRGVAI